MDRLRSSAGSTAYRRAWASDAPDDIAALFTEDVRYAPYPWPRGTGLAGSRSRGAEVVERGDSKAGWRFDHEIVASTAIRRSSKAGPTTTRPTRRRTRTRTPTSGSCASPPTAEPGSSTSGGCSARGRTTARPAERRRRIANEPAALGATGSSCGGWRRVRPGDAPSSSGRRTRR